MAEYDRPTSTLKNLRKLVISGREAWIGSICLSSHHLVNLAHFPSYTLFDPSLKELATALASNTEKPCGFKMEIIASKRVSFASLDLDAEFLTVVGLTGLLLGECKVVLLTVVLKVLETRLLLDCTGLPALLLHFSLSLLFPGWRE